VWRGAVDEVDGENRYVIGKRYGPSRPRADAKRQAMRWHMGRHEWCRRRKKAPRRAVGARVNAGPTLRSMRASIVSMAREVHRHREDEDKAVRETRCSLAGERPRLAWRVWLREMRQAFLDSRCRVTQAGARKMGRQSELERAVAAFEVATLRAASMMGHTEIDPGLSPAAALTRGRTRRGSHESGSRAAEGDDEAHLRARIDPARSTP